MRRCRGGGACLVLLLNPGTALGFSTTGATRLRLLSPSCDAATRALAATATAAATSLPPPRWRCRNPQLTEQETPRTRRSPGGSVTARERRGVGSLRATVASWPAVEGAESDGSSSSSSSSSSTGGRAVRGEGGAGDGGSAKGLYGSNIQRAAGGVVLIEQEGPAWTEIVWDESKERFVGADSLLEKSNTQKVRGAMGGLQLLLRHWFIPEDVTPDYYHFTLWRMFQRFVAGTVNVFGTQALLLALGIKSRRLGAAAAMSWVLKDALGKFGRILWASKMGRRFDSDAKRWRFRSSLLYAAGNGLEIVTYVFPASFLILAAMANSFKQMSMLTSSATRNTIYRSFARGENIGDITAKGEAQIAVVDLLGMLSGIGLCTMVGTSRRAIVAAYVLLSVIDISAIYLEIRAVVFTVLNHERTHLLARDYVASGSDPAAMRWTPKKGLPVLADGVAVGGSGDGDGGGGGGQGAPPLPEQGVVESESAAEPFLLDAAPASEDEGKALLSSPSTVSRRENIFLASRLTTNAFKTWSQAGVSMAGVTDLLDIFGQERYMLTYTGGRGGGNDGGSGAEGSVVKPGPSDTSTKTNKNHKKSGSRGVASVILHKDATGADTVKSLLALEYFQEELREAGFDVIGAPPPPLSQSSSPATKGDNNEQQRVNGKNPAVVNGDSGVGVAVAREGIAVEGWAKGAVTASSTVASTEGTPVMEAVAVEGAGAGTGVKVGEVAAVTAAAVAVPLVGAAAAAAAGVEVGAAAGEPNGEEGDQSRRAGGHHHHPSPTELRRCLEAARRRADDGTPGFFAALRSLGWSTEKFMFGNIKSRVEWRI